MKKFFVFIAVLLVVAPIFVINQSTFGATANPSKLYVSIGPASVPADNNAYNCVFVQLQDSDGQPARALQNTIITLSSSLTSIGTVDSSITILKGATYASANFYSTLTSYQSSIQQSAF